MAVTMDCTASCMLCFICYYLLLICTVSAGNKVRNSNLYHSLLTEAAMFNIRVLHRE